MRRFFSIYVFSFSTEEWSSVIIQIIIKGGGGSDRGEKFVDVGRREAADGAVAGRAS